MTEKVLCVDDDANVLASYQRNLRKQFVLEAALGGAEALGSLEKRGPFAVIVADMQMPDMDGIELLTRVKAQWPDTVRLMLTGNADQRTAVEAVNKGQVYRFLNKPCPQETLALALDDALKQYRLVTAERELLENTFHGSIKVLMEILATIEPRAFGRGELLREHMCAFLRSQGRKPNWEFATAALLSQIGYVCIPVPVMLRARVGAALTAPEREMLERVPAVGSELLSKIPRLEAVARAILYQHKNFDGSGFPPDSLGGEELPVASRILKVLTDLEELERAGASRPAALVQMQSRKGRYDPQVLDAAFKCFDAYLPQSSTVVATRKPVKINELKPGMMFVSHVATRDGMVVVPAGARLTPVALEKLRNFARLGEIQEPVFVEP